MAFPNLTFLNPVGILPVPGTTKLAVWEREGRIYFFENDPATATKTLILDLSNQCQGWDDCGLLGIAFHPDFVTNRQLFVYYSWVVPGTVTGNSTTRPNTFLPNRDRLARFTCNADGIANPDSETVLIDQVSSTLWHNGGGMFFHPDNGFLYLTIGDDVNNGNSQRIDNGLQSGVLRIDVDQRGGSISHPIPRQPLPAGSISQNYHIPNDNPFVGQPGVLEEFHAIGLRSPHRMTLDPVTKRIFIGDIGTSVREEISVIEPGDPAGLNFQWDRIEGLNGDLAAPYLGTNKRPIIDYGRGDGAAVIGGYVYRGSEFAADLGGKYIFGDNISNTVWYLDETTTPVTMQTICTIPRGPGPSSGGDYVGLSSFGHDHNNELYMCQLSSTGGQIFKFSRIGPPSSALPPTLSASGLFSDLATLTPATGFLEYSVNSPLWSDHATKKRWFAIPDDTRIGYSPSGEWTFPAGSIWLKHFDLPENLANPAVTRRLETRVLVRDTAGYVYGASYKWREDLSDADLVPTGISRTLTLGDRSQTWYFPGRSDCLQCHTPSSGGVLGMKSRQNNLSRLFPETGLSDNQLRAWNHIGLFTPSIVEASIPGLLKSVPLDHPTATAEEKARSYLDSNCSSCHRPGGVNSQWDARLDTPLASAGIVNGNVLNDLGITGSKVITPGNIALSTIHRRASTATASYKMPPLGKEIVDTAGIAALESWISSFAPPPVENLPIPWSHADVGPVATAGDATFSAGTFDLSASGSDIWDPQDSFHYAFQPLNGDGQITARVSNLSAADGWTKAGLMIRQSLQPGSPHVMALVSSAHGAHFQFRRTVDGMSASIPGPFDAIPPLWLRLQRVGDSITAATSPDGTTWQDIGSETIVLGRQVYIGLCLTAHNNSTTASATLDGVNLSGGVAGTSVKINFQLAGAPVPSGHLEDGGYPFAPRGNGFTYGWNADNSANHYDRNEPAAPDQRHDTFAHLQKPGGPWQWEIALPDGLYHLRAVSGDASSDDGRHHLTAEGSTLHDALQPGGPNTYLDASTTLTVADGRLTLAAGTNGIATKLNFIEIQPAATYGWDQWRETHFSITELTIPALSSAGADPDQDQISNLLEYALGSHPRQSSPGALPTCTKLPAPSPVLLFHFLRARSDITYIIEGSNNLSTWASLATNAGTVPESVSFPTTGYQFLRLKVVKP